MGSHINKLQRHSSPCDQDHHPEAAGQDTVVTSTLPPPDGQVDGEKKSTFVIRRSRSEPVFAFTP
jgi:hypothetical protein